MNNEHVHRLCMYDVYEGLSSNEFMSMILNADFLKVFDMLWFELRLLEILDYVRRCMHLSWKSKILYNCVCLRLEYLHMFITHKFIGINSLKTKLQFNLYSGSR